MEIGTLKELNVKPGDMVRHNHRGYTKSESGNMVFWLFGAWMVNIGALMFLKAIKYTK